MNWKLGQSRIAIVLSNVSMRLNGWARLTIVLSALWMVGWTTYKSESLKSEAREYARDAAREYQSCRVEHGYRSRECSHLDSNPWEYVVNHNFLGEAFLDASALLPLMGLLGLLTYWTLWWIRSGFHRADIAPATLTKDNVARRIVEHAVTAPKHDSETGQPHRPEPSFWAGRLKQTAIYVFSPMLLGLVVALLIWVWQTVEKIIQ